MADQQRVKKLLLQQLQEAQAHITVDDAIDGLGWHDVGIRPEGLPHSIWELVEHIRIAQEDILDFSHNPDYESRDWPGDYWPPAPQPQEQEQWERSIKAFREDHIAMVKLIEDPSTDVLQPLTHGNGQTLFREAMLIVDHNAYHIGQIVQVRRLLGNW